MSTKGTGRKRQKPPTLCFVVQAAQGSPVAGLFWDGTGWVDDPGQALQFGIDLADPWAACNETLLGLEPRFGPLVISAP